MASRFVPWQAALQPEINLGRANLAACRLQNPLLTGRGYVSSSRGLVAEWLRRGLQILAPRFDSGRGLHDRSICLLEPAGAECEHSGDEVV